MDKLIVSISSALAVFSFLCFFNINLYMTSFICIMILILIPIGFKIEDYLKNNGNDFFNKINYFFSKNDKFYNIDSKKFTYTFSETNNEYEIRKDIVICPKCKNLDRINDRYSWTSLSKANLIPTQPNQEISQDRFVNGWTYFTITFNDILEKNKNYNTGVILSGYEETEKDIESYLCSSIIKKTKTLILIVKLPESLNIKEAEYQIFSQGNEEYPIKKELMEYDKEIGGFKKVIKYPRKTWTYAISWKTNK